MWYALNRLVFHALCRVLFRYRVEGREHEPPPPFILIANHASGLDDPLAGLAVRAPVVFMAKEDLRKSPLMRAWVRSLGGFFVRRGEPDRAAMDLALRLLHEGRVVCVFPEGTRSPDGRMRRMRHGAAYLALRAGVPVLPLAMIGTHRALPKGASVPRPVHVRVRIGPPITVPRLEGRIPHAVLGEWTERFRQALVDLLPPDQHPLSRPAAPIPLGAERLEA